MSWNRTGEIALVALMLAVGAAAWWLRLGPQLDVDVEPLHDLPRHVGSWRSEDLPIGSAVESVLRADVNLQRAYRSPTGDVIWLYVGYYGTERGGRPEHTPRGCYTGAGWGIASARTLEVDPGGELRVNEYLVEREGQRRLVHFWYRSHRRTGLLGGLDQNVDRFLGRLFDRRADGALIRISTPLDAAGETAARSRLSAFGSAIDPVIGDHWPNEHTADREAQGG
ncbi:MAG: exosortase C-terminal domain/associated protein EpsI [Myxococcota bacterium]